MLLLKHLPSHRSETMQLTAYTPQGVFKTVDEPYDETKYQQYKKALEGMNAISCFWLTTDAGQCYLNEAMINQSVFLLAK